MVFSGPYRTFYFWTFWAALILESCDYPSISKKDKNALEDLIGGMSVHVGCYGPMFGMLYTMYPCLVGMLDHSAP